MQKRKCESTTTDGSDASATPPPSAGKGASRKRRQFVEFNGVLMTPQDARRHRRCAAPPCFASLCKIHLPIHLVPASRRCAELYRPQQTSSLLRVPVQGLHLVFVANCVRYVEQLFGGGDPRHEGINGGLDYTATRGAGQMQCPPSLLLSLSPAHLSLCHGDLESGDQGNWGLG